MGWAVKQAVFRLPLPGVPRFVVICPQHLVTPGICGLTVGLWEWA